MCRRRKGHAAAAGSEGIEHGRAPSGCTSGGRVPPLGRSNDRSPPTRCPRIHRTGRPHTRAVARAVRPSSMGASQHYNPALGCLSVIYLLSAPGSAVGPLVASHPLPLCRALAPRLYRRPRALRGGLACQCGAHGLVGSRSCTSTPAATCLCNPHFRGPPKGRVKVAVTWHGHPRPCACGVACALDKGSGYVYV